MAKLKEESKLYAELSKVFDDKGEKNISLDFFEECVDIAKKGSKREIKFILFRLKCLYDDVDTGLEKINVLTKIIKIFVGKNMKASFMISVLETALDEK